MVWITRFSGLPANQTLPEPTDLYAAGTFTFSGAVTIRDWNTLLLGPGYGAPKAYETVAGIGASIGSVLRVTGVYASRFPLGGLDVGAGIALYEGASNEGAIIFSYEFNPIFNPGDGSIESRAEESGVSQLVGTLPFLGKALPHIFRIYWNGTPAVFAIPDAGFGGWVVAAGTVSYWGSEDNGATWTRLGDRAIAGTWAPDRVGIWGFYNPAGGGDSVTFSSFEVAEEVAPQPPTVEPIDPTAGSTGVAKDAGASFKIVEALDPLSIVLATVFVYVRGVLIFNGPSLTFAEGWKSSTIEADGNGYTFFLRPDRLEWWRNLETVDVRVIAENSVSLSVDFTYSFNAARKAFRQSIYRMVLASLRKMDRNG